MTMRPQCQLSAVQQYAARRGETQPFATAVQQRRAYDLFQAPDLLAQGGLGDEDPLRGVREAARIGDRHEVAQMPQFKTLRRLRAVRGPRYWFWLCVLHVGHLRGCSFFSFRRGPGAAVRG
jgi:hypothetical protein